MGIKIGTVVTLDGKDYTVVGPIARSYLIERDGVRYKVSKDKLNKYLNQPKYPYLTARLEYVKIFDKSAKLPTNKEEAIPWFRRLSGELSGENLHGDGEFSPRQVAQRKHNITMTWKELEEIIGEKIEMNDCFSL